MLGGFFNRTLTCFGRKFGYEFFFGSTFDFGIVRQKQNVRPCKSPYTSAELEGSMSTINGCNAQICDKHNISWRYIRSTPYSVLVS